MQALRTDLTAIELENKISDVQSSSLALFASFGFDNPRHTALVAWDIQALHLLDSNFTREKAVVNVCRLKTASAHMV